MSLLHRHGAPGCAQGMSWPWGLKARGCPGVLVLPKSNQPLTRASGVVRALSLPCAVDPFEVTGQILVPATHARLKVAGQLWPERGDIGEVERSKASQKQMDPPNIPFPLFPCPTPQVYPMQGSQAKAGYVLGPGPWPSALWSCSWTE